MQRFEKVIGDIYRLEVPFEDIYTAVFLLRTKEGDILLDCATNKHDVENIIIPALRDIGSLPKYLICTHSHGDHMGGLPFMMSYYKDVTAMFCSREAFRKHSEWGERIIIPNNGDKIFSSIEIISLPGHSEDSIGLLDVNTKTLLSGDSIQLGGVGRYGTGVENGEKYRKTLQKIISMDVENLVASHEYYPLGSIAFGKDNVERFVRESAFFAENIKAFAKQNSAVDCSEIALLYNKYFSDYPPIGVKTVKALKNLL
ncbi:MAG: MBL fold metallo-hydrolase [Clostridia bacterium]|nr:MBL fold metallo-hydrolase [Clostridia bacterium]